VSYDFHIGEHSYNITWNVMPMFVFAFTGRPWSASNDREARQHQRDEAANDTITQFKHLNGRVAKDVLPFLVKALLHMSNEEHREVYKSMNAKNGWGTHATTLTIFTKMVQACRENLDETITIR